MPIGPKSTSNEDVYKHLPALKVDIESPLWVVEGSEKKYTRTWTVNISPEMRAALEALVNNANLPFMGNGSALGRHFFAAGIESLSDQMDPQVRTMWRRLVETERELTNEWYVAKLRDHLDKRVALLKEWSSHGEWDAVVDDLRSAQQDVDDLPRPAWKRRAAQGWLAHKGVKALLRQWELRMPDEDAESWRVVQEIMAHMALVGRVDA